MYNMYLNPEKCTFKVGGGKFLGFMIIHQGIEANPIKCISILEMRSPTNVQEVQKLNGRLASCHTLISFGDNCLSTCKFSPAKLSFLTSIATQSVGFRDVTERNEQDTQNRGNFLST